MALINCPECKKEVSNTAKHCPLCGYQPPQISLWKLDLGFEGNLFRLIIFFGVVIILLGVWAARLSPSNAATIIVSGLTVAFSGLLLLTIRSLR